MKCAHPRASLELARTFRKSGSKPPTIRMLRQSLVNSGERGRPDRRRRRPADGIPSSNLTHDLGESARMSPIIRERYFTIISPAARRGSGFSGDLGFWW